MSKETKSKRFISIRLRLFLQVGAIVLIAVMLILALNKWYLSSIYILNQKRTMQYLRRKSTPTTFPPPITALKSHY